MAIALLTADTYVGSANSPQWGIFQNGIPVVTADNVVSQEFKSEFILADFPVEGGSFESYDKVYIPYDVRFRFSAGGSQANRTALLQSIAAIAGNLQLYDAVSPEAIYLHANIKHYDYRRTSEHGVGLIIVDVWLSEVRPAGGNSTDTASPTSAPPINNGTVQPTTALASLANLSFT